MDGQEIVAWAQALSRHSDSTQHYTRTYLTPAHQAAAREIAQSMREAGMAVRTDAVGNVIGRYEGASPGARALVIGSHFDSVRDGGKYDGVLGILLGIACVAELARSNERLPVAIEGAPPNLAHAIEGCRFAERCPTRKPDCKTNQQVLRLAFGRKVRCQYAE